MSSTSKQRWFWGIALVASAIAIGSTVLASGRSQKLERSLVGVAAGVLGLGAIGWSLRHAAREKSPPAPAEEPPPEKTLMSVEPLSQEEFVEDIRRRLQVLYPELELRFVAERYAFEARNPQDDESLEIYLGNHYQRYLEAHPENREATLERIGRVAYIKQAFPGSFAEAKGALMPSVRDRVYPESIRLRFEVQNEKALVLPHQQIGDRLTVCVVVDSEDHIYLVDEEKLAEWGITFEEALRLATANLADRPMTLVELAAGLYAFCSNDDYDATRLLLLEDLSDNLPVRGDRAIMTPNRNLLLVADSANPDSLLEMQRLAAGTWERSGGINGFVATWSGEWWQEWLPAPDSPAHQGLRDLAIRSLGEQYQEQKEFLEALNERNGRDVFVASFMGRETPEGLLSFCTWSKGVDALLPQTDAVAFYQSEVDRVVGPVPWAKVVERVGSLLEETKLYPTRYRARNFPDAAALDELAAFADERFLDRRR